MHVSPVPKGECVLAASHAWLIMKLHLTITAAIAIVLGQATMVSGQRASQSISLNAHLASVVRLSQDSIPLDFLLTQGYCGTMSLPLNIAWNVDQFSTQIQLIASFSHSNAALTSSGGYQIPASAITIQIAGSSWKTFPESRQGVASSGLLLTTINTEQSGRQASRHFQLQVHVCKPQSDPPDLEYSGRVDLRAIIR